MAGGMASGIVEIRNVGTSRARGVQLMLEQATASGESGRREERLVEAIEAREAVLCPVALPVTTSGRHVWVAEATSRNRSSALEGAEFDVGSRGARGGRSLGTWLGVSGLALLGFGGAMWWRGRREAVTVP